MYKCNAGERFWTLKCVDWYSIKSLLFGPMGLCKIYANYTKRHSHNQCFNSLYICICVFFNISVHRRSAAIRTNSTGGRVQMKTRASQVFLLNITWLCSNNFQATHMKKWESNRVSFTLSFRSQRNLSLWALLCIKTPSRWPVSTERISMAFSPQPIIWLEWI